MKADYDSEADALSIVLARFKSYDEQEAVDEDNCHVGLVGGRPVDIEAPLSVATSRSSPEGCRPLRARRHCAFRHRQGCPRGTGPARDHGPFRVVGCLIRAAL